MCSWCETNGNYDVIGFLGTLIGVHSLSDSRPLPPEATLLRMATLRMTDKGISRIPV